MCLFSLEDCVSLSMGIDDMCVCVSVCVLCVCVVCVCCVRVVYGNDNIE